jgi:hypothetical protein
MQIKNMIFSIGLVLLAHAFHFAAWSREFWYFTLGMICLSIYIEIEVSR